MSSIDAAAGGGYTPDISQAKSRAAASPAANPAGAPAALPGRGRTLPEKPEERFIQASDGTYIMPGALTSVQRHGDGTVTVGEARMRMSETEYERVSAAVLANLRDYQNEYKNWKAQCLLNR